MTRFPPLDWHLSSLYSEADAMQHLGRIPLLIDPTCLEPVWMQVQTNYPHGWHPEPPGLFTFTADEYLIYPGLPPAAPAAMAEHHDERILVYPAGFVVVAQRSGAFTVARIEP